jgi:ABC-2 type transport system ATP-binding protein/transposase
MRRTGQSRKWKEDIFKAENWEYNRKGKYYVCPEGKRLAFKETKKRKADSGWPVTLEKHECESCKYCRLKKQCSKAKGNRTIERNERWLRLKQKARRIAEDGRYMELRKQRPVEV